MTSDQPAPGTSARPPSAVLLDELELKQAALRLPSSTNAQDRLTPNPSIQPGWIPHQPEESSGTARPTRPPLATQSSPASSTSIARSRTATGLSGSAVKARVKLTGGAGFADGSGPALAPPLSPSAGYSWSDGGSEVGSAVGNGGAGPSIVGRRALSPASSFASGPARSAVTSSPRVAGSAVGGTSARPGQVHARSSPVAPTVGSRPGSAGPPRHVRSNSAGLNALLPSLSSPASRSGTPNVPSSALSASTSSRPLTASVRASTSAPRGPPSASAPSTPLYQIQSHPSPGVSRSRSPPAAERGSGAESPPQYFSQQRSASIPQDRYLSYSPPPTLPPLPPQPAEPVHSFGTGATTHMTSTPGRRIGGDLEARRLSASSFSSSGSPDSRFSPSAGSALSQPVSTSSFSSVSYDPPPVSPNFLNGLPSIPSASCLDVAAQSPQETIKPSLVDCTAGVDAEDAPEDDPLSRQEEEDAKVNRKIADLEISNASLLAINHSLEAAKAKQAREIRDLRRRFRSGTNLPPPLLRSSSSRHSLGRSQSSSHSSQGSASGESTDDNDEAEEDDPQFARMKEVMLSMLEKGMSALAVKVPEPSGWGRSVGGGGGRVLGILEMGEWREKEEAGGEEDEAESSTPSPRPEAVAEEAAAVVEDDEMTEA